MADIHSFTFDLLTLRLLLTYLYIIEKLKLPVVDIYVRLQATVVPWFLLS